MCLAELKPHSFTPLYSNERGCQKPHSLPALEFKSNFPVDATTFKKSGKSRNPKPQKSTCMIVHVQRRAAAWTPTVVILFSSGHSGPFRLRSACHIQF